MSPDFSVIEKLILKFAIKELKNNPQILVNLIKHILETKKVDPEVIKDVAGIATELIPLILAEVNP